MDAAFLQSLLSECQQATAPGVRPVSASHLAGDASGRRYTRIWVEGWRLPTVVLMSFAPASARSSDEFTGRAAPSPAEPPFLRTQRFLSFLQQPAPEVYLPRFEEGRIWLQDLGDGLLYHEAIASSESVRLARYRQIIPLLVSFQRSCLDRAADFDRLVDSRRFDAELLRWELEHFVEWNLHALHGVTLTGGDRAVVSACFDDLVGRILTQPYVPTHRDFQSKNLMWHNDRWWFIDFQDMLWGPLCYDLTALLRDSYVVLSQPERSALLAAYYEEASRAELPVPASYDDFVTMFHLQSLQRKLKDCGRFVFIDRVKGNPSFLRYLPATLRYISEAFDELPAYKAARDVLGRIEPGVC